MKTNNEIPMYPVIGPDGEIMYAPKVYGLGALPAIPAAVSAVAKVGTAVVKTVQKIGDALGIGQNFKGYTYRELAAAIWALRALGYTDDQIIAEPLAWVVRETGKHESSIDTVQKSAPNIIQRRFNDLRNQGVSIPKPAGSPFSYYVLSNAESQALVESYGYTVKNGQLSIMDYYGASQYTVPTTTSRDLIDVVEKGVTDVQSTYQQYQQQPMTQQEIIAQSSAGQPGQPAMPGTNQMLFLGLGAAALVGLYGYQQGWFGKKGKLGDLDTAKTKAGKVRQRKAVFARMEKEGELWPKKKGARKKPRAKRKSKR